MKQREINQVGFLIFPDFPMACLTSMIEPLRVANEITGTKCFDWTIVAEQPHKVQSSAKVWFEPDLSLADADGFDLMFVLSGPSALFYDQAGSEAKLRKLARHGMTMGAVSGGVFPLARAGLLERSVTSVHWCYEAAFRAAFPNLTTTDQVISIDADRLTASGAVAAFDLTLHLIDQIAGEAVAAEVACWFQHPFMRGEATVQMRPTFKAESVNDMLPPIVKQAVGIFAEHIEEPIRVADVACAIKVSVRQLERSFKFATNTSPLGYYRSMRMYQARQLLFYTRDTLTQIAHAVGYGSSSTMAKNYIEVFGVHPNEDRTRTDGSVAEAR